MQYMQYTMNISIVHVRLPLYLISNGSKQVTAEQIILRPSGSLAIPYKQKAIAEAVMGRRVSRPSCHSRSCARARACQPDLVLIILILYDSDCRISFSFIRVALSYVQAIAMLQISIATS